MFDDTRVLIVEDDGLTALDLALSVKDAGGKVIGPIPTAAGALALLETVPVDAAILDTSLVDRDITPVALLLLSRNIPILVYTGLGLPTALAERHPEIPVLLKPAPASRVVTRLVALRNEHLSPVARSGEPRSRADGGASSRNRLAFLTTQISVEGGDRVGRSVFSDGKLVGILIPVTPEESGGGPGGWYLEAGFGPCGPMTIPTPPIFADLDEAAQWVSERVESLH